MKSLLISFILLIPTQVNATTFTGVMSGTPTYANDETFWEYFPENSLWSLTYFYESDTIDGSFIPYLTLIRSGGTLIQSGNSSTTPILIIENSVVTSFQYSMWNIWTVETGEWSFNNLGGGVMKINNPVSVHEPSILALSLLGLFLFRRIRA